MKNSAWYYKLWRKKLNELPVEDDVNSAWDSMHLILDNKIPNGSGKTSVVKPLVAKLFTLLGYALPAAAMISTVTYISLPKHIKQKIFKGNHHQAKIKYQNQPKINSTLTDSVLFTDSIKPDINSPDSLSNTQTQTQLHAQKTRSVEQYAAYSKSAATGANLPKTLPVTISSRNSPVVVNLNNHQIKLPEILANHTKVKGFNNPLNKQLQQDYKQIPAVDTASSTGKVAGQNRQNLETDTAKTIKGITPDYKNYEKGSTTAFQLDNLLSKPVGGTDKNLPVIGKNKKAYNRSGKTGKDLTTPVYKFGFEAGLNAGSKNNNLYAGVNGNLVVSKQLLLGIGLRVNAKQLVEDSYSYPVTYRADSVVLYQIADSRKITAVDIPFTLEYRVANYLSLKAGPVLSFPLVQGTRNYTVTPTGNARDSIYRSKGIDSIAARSAINKIGLGFSGGVSLYFNHIGIEARYQQLTPYKVSNSLGSYKQKNSGFQVGFSYRF